MITEILKPLINKALDFIPDTKQRDKAKHEVLTLILDAEAQGMLSQIDLNKEEAKHKSVFVSGWRPAIGWICGLSIAYSYILSPILNWILVLNGHHGSLPSINTGELMTLITGMLGMSGFRTYEKMRGINNV